MKVDKYIPMISIKSWSLDIRPDYHIGKTEGLWFQISKIGNFGLVKAVLNYLLQHYIHYIKKNLIQPLDKKINQKISDIGNTINPLVPIKTKLLQGKVGLSLEKMQKIIHGTLYINLNEPFIPS